MPIVLHRPFLPQHDAALLSECQKLSSSAASDALNRGSAMGGAIKPLQSGLRLCGRARTVCPMRGDNSAVHAAISLLEPGDVLVVAGGGDIDVALIGDIAVEGALMRGCAGIVIDGAVRDLANLRISALPIFAAGASPRGPQKGAGGDIDGEVACGGVIVRPGDLIVGDDDGVTAVPAGRVAHVIQHAAASAERERSLIARIRAGESHAAVIGVNATVPMDGA